MKQSLPNSSPSSTSLQPGPDGRAAQSELPDPLVLQSGKTVTTVSEWKQQRRPEILELFREYVYGRAPIERPDTLKFETLSDTADAMDGQATRRQIKICFRGAGGGGAIRLLLFIPNRPTGPAPCLLLINHGGPQNTDVERAIKSAFWPAEELVQRGYAAATFEVADVDPDEDDNFKNGVHGIFDARDKPRSPDAWGTIAAWAWGASRVMDYLQTDARLDATRVGLVGHSRGGKTALWAGAQDERFALVVSNNSGSTGAALARGKQGETIAKINRQFPHWFAENYKRFNDRENELPVDQHMLLALTAPRLLYIASATEDAWSDPGAEFQAAVAAGPVYELLGLRGVQTSIMPEPETPLLDGHIGYHLRTGKHDLTGYDWHRFMDFADRHFAKPT